MQPNCNLTGHRGAAHPSEGVTTRFRIPNSIIHVVCSILYNLAKAPDGDVKWLGDGGMNFFFNAISECWKTFNVLPHTHTHSQTAKQPHTHSYMALIEAERRCK